MIPPPRSRPARPGLTPPSRRRPRRVAWRAATARTLSPKPNLNPPYPNPLLNEVNDDGYCGKRYKSCNADSNGCSCTDGTSGWLENADGTTSYEYYCSASTDGLCFDNSVDSPGDTSTMCAPTEELGLGWVVVGIARHRSTVERVPTAIHPPSANGHPQITGATRAHRKTFASRSTARPRMLSRSVALASRAR